MLLWLDRFVFVAGISLLALVAYFAPARLAFVRFKARRQVLALNFFLGWTYIGWVVALVWALGDLSAADQDELRADEIARAERGAPIDREGSGRGAVAVAVAAQGVLWLWMADVLLSPWR